MPVYNGEKFLEEAIQSILHQTYKHWEFIIINDGSTDKTHNIIQKYLSEPRLKYIHKKNNEGIVKALNEGIDAAIGKYIARMDADDLSLPERLEKQFQFLEKNPDVVVCGSNYFTLKYNKKKILRVTQADAYLKTQLFFSTPFCHPTVMINRNLAGEEFHYEESYRHAEDYELWKRLAFKGKFHILEDALYIYRDHPNQVSYEQQATQKHLKNDIRKRFASYVFGSVNDEILEGMNLIGNNTVIEKKEDFIKVRTALEFLYNQNKIYFLSDREGKKCLAKFWSDMCAHHHLGLWPFKEFLKDASGLSEKNFKNLLKIFFKILIKNCFQSNSILSFL
jgi:glycosyltransferase involved in cell wall biosynthesis